jgi:hypothetical protein
MSPHRILLLAGLCAFAATAAHAGNITLSGDRLALTTTGDTDVSIETDNSQGASVRIVGDDLSCLKARGNQVVEVSTYGCGDDLGHLTVTVPPSFPVSLAMQGSGSVHIGDVGGELNVAVNSDGSLNVGSTRTLMLAVHGSGDVSIASVRDAADINVSGGGDVKLGDLRGVLHARLNGSGDLSVGNITAPAVDISLSGSGDATFGDGGIGVLRAQTHGSGDITVQARVGTADVEASGGGDIKLDGPTGTIVRRSATGGSDIHVGDVGTQQLDLNQLKQDLNGLKVQIPPIPPIPPMPPLPNFKGMTIDLSDDDAPHHHSHSESGVGHFIAAVLVLVVAYFIWRTVARNGGWRAIGSGAGQSAQSTHPGVLAVRDSLTRLDGRLAQVEHYVTSREFDLQRKFRDLDKH